jgi:hypothetical protein
MKRWTRVLVPLFALGVIGIGVGGVVVPSSSGAAPPDARASSIALTIGGVTTATFSSCTGIGSQTTPATGGSGATKTFGTNLPIQVTCEGAGPVQQLWTLRQQAELGNPNARQNAELEVFGSTGQVAQTYLMENAWVSALDDTAKVGAETTEVVTFTADAITVTLPTSEG